MNNKGKIITFAIIVLISIGGLLCKGYLSDEVYVLNEEENTSKNTEDTINKMMVQRIVVLVIAMKLINHKKM